MLSKHLYLPTFGGIIFHISINLKVKNVFPKEDKQNGKNKL